MADPGPDYGAVLATLPADDRATVLRWLDLLGMEPDELECVPPLRQLVATMAVLILASDMDELPREAQFREAGAALGLNGDSIMRTWYNWQGTAARNFFRQRDDAA